MTALVHMSTRPNLASVKRIHQTLDFSHLYYGAHPSQHACPYYQYKSRIRHTVYDDSPDIMNLRDVGLQHGATVRRSSLDVLI